VRAGLSVLFSALATGLPVEYARVANSALSVSGAIVFVYEVRSNAREYGLQERGSSADLALSFDPQGPL